MQIDMVYLANNKTVQCSWPVKYDISLVRYKNTTIKLDNNKLKICIWPEYGNINLDNTTQHTCQLVS